MRTRLTPFARLLLFMIVVLPLTYFGAAYYNGEDPMANLKSWFSGQSAPKGGSASARSGNTAACADEIEALKRENYQLRQELLQKSEELRRLQGNGGNSSSGNRQKWGN